MDVASALAERDPRSALDSVPWLGDAIDADAAAGRFTAWGASTVIDEIIQQPVLSADLFDALHERAGLAARWPVGNAGLLHVYGYLLSPVLTPFGLKRDRWVGGDLARLCGLAPDGFVPWAGERTLLERVTVSAEGVLADHVVRTQQLGAATARIALTASEGPAALAYALETSAGRRLITMFPVLDAAEILADIDEAVPRARWNAALAESDVSGS